MIIDFTEVGGAALEGRTYDVCIVGTGPAGITLATNLSRNLSILLLEAGGFDVSEESQQIYKGTITGRDYFDLDATRLRCFGGSSNHWGGWCQTLDDYDFEARPYVAYSGWPIGKKDLDPYFDRAAEILDIDFTEEKPLSFRVRLDQALSANGFVKPFRPRLSPPTLFGTKFRSSIEESPNITCLLRANLTDILLNESGTAVSDVEITGYGRERTTVPARRVVIAAGGIENPRILLNCNRQVKVGLGNQYDLVGRFFGEHPDYDGGWLVLQDDLRDAVLDTFTHAEMINYRNANFYSATRQFAREHEILNFEMIVRPRPSERGTSFKQRIRLAMCKSDWLSEGFDFVFRDGRPTCVDGYFNMHTEQAPNPDSRIRLIEDRDQFGWRRISLDWRMLPIDKRTIAVAATQLATLFATHDMGRVRVREWILSDDLVFPGLAEQDHIAGKHHMGTTRMSDDPKHGVVNRDCRVHGISNLYVAGSSVFPAFGFATPTFTIVQLSLRLASHLNSS